MNIDELAAEWPDPDKRTEPRNQELLDKVAAAAPAVAAAEAEAERREVDSYAAETKAWVLEQADEAWRFAQDDEAFSLQVEFDMVDGLDD